MDGTDCFQVENGDELNETTVKKNKIKNMKENLKCLDEKEK